MRKQRMHHELRWKELGCISQHTGARKVDVRTHRLPQVFRRRMNIGCVGRLPDRESDDGALRVILLRQLIR